MDWSWIEEGLRWMGSLGVFTLGTATVTGIAGYLFKTVFSHVLSKQSEEHKALLNQQTQNYKSILDQQTEHHKAELQKMNNKHQITFSKLHIDRAETIKDLYVKLVHLHERSLALLGSKGRINHSIDRSIDSVEMRKLVLRAQEVYLDFIVYYRPNKIYFSEDICKLFESIIVHMEMTLTMLLGYNPELIEEMEGWEEEEGKIADRILNEIPKLKNALELEFRKLLGVIEE
ncbi:hypothetical protein [Bacillus cereus]|uniref:hypothetical protein n=1 Tax=Bacillus cereus TaxID=1396 RepID=UPI00094384F7|nr:hypothetical protein [Bacillus cereus]